MDTAGPGFRLLLENVHHFTDGCDAGKGFLGKGKGIGNRSDQFVVDVNRAATHSGKDSGAGNRTTGEPCQDHILFRPHVFQSVGYTTSKFNSFTSFRLVWNRNLTGMS